MRRAILTGGVAAIAILMLATGTVLGGGWATVTADDASAGAQPRAGETDQFGFMVLQHGQTPAGWVHATLVLENIATGETVRVTATPKGADGHFVAAVRFPDAGYWSWRVELAELIVESQPQMLTVLTTSGALPAFDPSTALTMIERAKSDLRAEFQDQYSARIDSLENSLSTVQAREKSLERDRVVLTERITAAERIAAAETGAPSGVPIAATLAIAVLSGALAGFVMAGLGRRGGRPESETETAPTPEYVPTAR